MSTEQNLRHTWKLFKADDAIVEVRALGCHGKHRAWAGWTQSTVSGYFDDEDTFVEAVMMLDASGKPEGIYVTLNPVQPDLLARANNRLIGAKQGSSTSAEYILCRRWLLLDFDPVRPKDVSSTQAELKAALDAAKTARKALQGDGFSKSIMACSGNGVHLLYRVDLPNDEAAQELIKGALLDISKDFSTEAVTVDTMVHDANRIVKCYGTVARKGDVAGERKHRRSLILEGIKE